MPATMLQAPTSTVLTTLTEDEILFRDNIHPFASEQVRPRYRQNLCDLEVQTSIS